MSLTASMLPKLRYPFLIRGSGLSVGCIAAWPMGEDFSSLVLNDLSGMGNHVDFSANLRWLDNWLGVCPKFNGTDADGTVRNEGHFDFERTDPFSIIAAIYPYAVDATQSIISKLASSGSFEGWEFKINSDGTLNLLLENSYGGSNYLSVSSTATLSANDFALVAATYDGSSSGIGVKLYKDGLDAGNSASGTLSASILNSISPRIGSRNGASIWFNGQIHSMAVFNRVLDPVEITVWNYDWWCMYREPDSTWLDAPAPPSKIRHKVVSG